VDPGNLDKKLRISRSFKVK
jgi:hypothetical protein